ncbi:MAG: amidohydrolase family protein [Bryobacteraceae bacterium]|nr:amidohydrolase family protein [Bryobacteraceae bacterium]
MRRREFTALAAGAALMEAKPNYRIVDSHVHVWKADPRYPWAKETTSPPKEDATAETLLDLMKQHGVERTVIIQVIHYRWDNRYLADVLKQYPKLFHGVARVNPEDPAAPDHLSKLVEEQRFRGVRLSPAGNAAGDWIRGELMAPLWSRCQKLKTPMTLLAPVSRMPDAAKLIEAHPDLTVVIDHMADSPIDKPGELEKLLALKRYPKVFVKISHAWSLSKQQYPWADTHAQVKRLYDAFGPKRLMWGTDWPVSARHARYGETLSLVRDEMKFLNEEDKSWILSKTVERVWPFPK